MTIPFHRTISLVLLAGIGLGFSSCYTMTTGSIGSSGSSASLEQNPRQVKRGVSNKASVKAMLGKPKRRVIDPTGERWFYGSAAQKTSVNQQIGEQVLSTGIGFIPYAGGAINSVRSVARAGQTSGPGATISFNKRGIVQDYSVEVD